MSDKKVVLVIDDDDDVLQLAKIALDGLNVEVMTASGGGHGLAVAGSACPDLVLCDMIMESDGEGLNVCRKIRGSGCKVPIVLVSSIGHASMDNFDVLAEGFNGVLQKPFTAAALRKLVSEKLGI